MAVKKESKISHNKIEKYLGYSNKESLKTLNIKYGEKEEDTFELQIRSWVTKDAIANIINNITFALFNSTDVNGDLIPYVPSLKEIIVAKYIFEYYTNLKADDLDEVERLMYSDIYNIVKENIDEDHLFMLVESIDEAIEYQKRLNIEGFRLEHQELIESVETMIEQMSDLMNKFDGTELNEGIDKLDKVVEIVGKSGDINDLAKAQMSVYLEDKNNKDNDNSENNVVEFPTQQ